MAKKRERLDVFYDMLNAIKESRTQELGPTRLLYSSNLSSLMFKEYISELIEKKFVEEIEYKGKKKYKLLDKGYEFLNRYKEMMNFIDNFGL